MPEMDGLTCTQEIRKRETNDGKGEHIPIIAMTANAFPDSISKCYQSGMDDFIAKPVKMQMLKGILEKYLS